MADSVYYYISDGWYKGDAPNFYAEDEFSTGAVLEKNFLVIKNEILQFYQQHKDEIKANFTPYNYIESGWKTINLYSYFLKYPKACSHFPNLDAIVNTIPGMCLAQIAVLEPNTRIKAHIGDTDAIVRTHMGIRIPGEYPDLGLRIRNEERGWQEGKTFSFCIVNRHYAWNYTDDYRIILMVDTIRPEHFQNRFFIAGNTLAAIGMKLCATKVPLLKKMPCSVTKVIQHTLGKLFTARLWFQRKLNI